MGCVALQVQCRRCGAVGQRAVDGVESPCCANQLPSARMPARKVRAIPWEGCAAAGQACNGVADGRWRTSIIRDPTQAA